jgi:hypothetical protein
MNVFREETKKVCRSASRVSREVGGIRPCYDVGGSERRRSGQRVVEIAYPFAPGDDAQSV